jgi:CheY-like chemotaxis protein
VNKYRILLVEDNPLNRQLARDLLEYRGHEVALAATVDEAQGQLRQATPDIVLVDIQIPGGGGETLLRSIRACAAWKALPVAAVTAYAMAGDKERLIAAGFDAYIGKPIDTKTFGATVESLVHSAEPREKPDA